ncbi:MAG: ATP-dependent DNA helicase RecG, partial [Methylococcales bacterium]|nr:ATP-dependent DNA helicase RecG [Methylococcales bacterium]
KTVVAACAALAVIDSGYQVALMAPTELLAEQHAANFKAWLAPLQISVSYLSGQQKGLQRKTLLEQIAAGSAAMVIGTHALFQEQVVFAQLGLVIIDEQHRFGVNQRLALLEKGTKEDLYPHQLIMTATPIPRTLAMLQFSDLQVSIIDQLPPGRVPVKTSVMTAERRDEVIQRIATWTQAGRQTYWVCTLIDESEILQGEAAEKTVKLLAQALPDVRVALVHGRMKADEKEQIMQAFKKHTIDLLVATTVIEVGVDVANAALMIIENAERLGLSQLHQLRGRVGRGSEASYCILMYKGPLSDTAHQRLSIVRQSSDGFEIAERDLEMRGPGELMGTRQTGEMQFRVANLDRDKALLPQVLAAAKLIERQYPEHIEALISRWLGTSAQSSIEV